MGYYPELQEQHYAVSKDGLVKSPPFIFDADAVEWACSWIQENLSPGTFWILRTASNNSLPFARVWKVVGKRSAYTHSGWKFWTFSREYTFESRDFRDVKQINRQTRKRRQIQ